MFLNDTPSYITIVEMGWLKFHGVVFLITDGTVVETQGEIVLVAVTVRCLETLVSFFFKARYVVTKT